MAFRSFCEGEFHGGSSVLFDKDSLPGLAGRWGDVVFLKQVLGHGGHCGVDHPTVRTDVLLTNHPHPRCGVEHYAMSLEK